jgi:hypothetical protein
MYEGKDKFSRYNFPGDTETYTMPFSSAENYINHNSAHRPGSVVGIATAYGLDDPGIETRWGEIFRTCPDRP